MQRLLRPALLYGARASSYQETAQQVEKRSLSNADAHFTYEVLAACTYQI